MTRPTVHRVESVSLPEPPPGHEATPAQPLPGTVTASTDEAEAALLRHADASPGTPALALDGHTLVGHYEPDGDGPWPVVVLVVLGPPVASS